jgi:superfamily II DNA or RNA helicase
MNLRPYQVTAIEKIREAYRDGYRAPLLVLPTGGGKTVIFSEITRSAAERGKRVVILLHRVELVRQTSEKLLQFGVPHGVIHPKYKPRYYEAVQVASIQTLVKRTGLIDDPDLIVIDEAHHASAGTWQRVLEAYPNARCLGVTATPMRGDGKGLDDCFDILVEGVNIQELIADGYLVAPKVKQPSKIDFEGVRIVRGDYDQKEIEVRVNQPKIIGDIVAHYTKYAHKVPAVVFCVTVAHAESMAEGFRSAGYNALSVDGTTDDETRQRTLNGLGDGTVDVVCSCNLISEGTDIPAIGCAILVRKTISEGLYLQQVGRALRPSEGKVNAIILDHVGNTLIHGLPHQLRSWSLQGRPKGKKRGEKSPDALQTRQCPSCYNVHERSPQCPECGHVYAAEREMIVVDGELRDAEEVMMERKAVKMRQGKAKTKADLEAIAKEKGYKKGWVFHMMKIKGITH